MSDDSINDITNILSNDDIVDENNNSDNIDEDLSDDVIEVLGLNNNHKDANGNNNYDDWIPQDDEEALQDLQESEELETIDSLI